METETFGRTDGERAGATFSCVAEEKKEQYVSANTSREKRDRRTDGRVEVEGRKALAAATVLEPPPRSLIRLR